MSTDKPVTTAAGAMPGRRMPRALQRFFEIEAAAGIVLLGSALVALAWANSPWSGSYRALWGTRLSLGLGRWVLAEDLQHWINDGLMVLFFFVVGLEIKRELVRGDLRRPRTAALPAVAALAGMALPALLFLAVAGRSAGSKGWGIPMATDIAFAIGVMALLGNRVPSSLRLFLLTLAIVDDVGAIVVIAVFYGGDIRFSFLAMAVGLIAVMLGLRRAGVVWMPPYVVVGVAVWLATRASGVHATMAGVVLGLLAPARALTPAAVARRWAGDLGDDPSPAELDDMTRLARTSVSPAERLEHRLHPWSSFVVLPLFALANAGVTIKASSFGSPVALRVAIGVTVGLVIGKLVGITAASWLAVRGGLAGLPEGATRPMLVGVAGLGGIGFTVSLFIAGLAFEAGPIQDAAKIGVLSASVVAALLGALILTWTSRQPSTL